MRSKVAIAIVCGAVLVLGACERNAVIGDTTALERELATAQAARDAAEAALGRAQNALADAQRVLDAATPGDQQAAQERVREVLQTAEENVKTAADGVAAAIETAPPNQRAGLEETRKALTSTRMALASVRALFPEADRTDMHTPLARARTALAQARTDLAAADRALEEAPNRAAQNALTEARNAITTAQLSLLPRIERELDAIERELDAEAERAAAAEKDLATRTTERDTARTERDTARAERDALRDEHVSPPLFRSARAPRELGATIAITRTARTVPNADGDAWVANPDALDIATDAVPYAAGTTLASRAGDEFPMRAITFRGDIRQGSQRGMTGAAADNDGRYPIIQGPGNTLGNANDHTKTAVISAIRLSEDGGLTLEVGGSGVVFNEFQWDIRGTEADGPDGIPGDGGATTATTATDFHAAMFRRAGETPPSVGDTLTADQAAKLTGWAADNCAGVTFPCWDGNMRDLTIDFGKPSPDPDGESGYHWASKIPSSEGQPKPAAGDAMHRWAKPKVDHFVDPERGAGEYRGEYRVWLSNYAGLDTGATDAETDDSHRYLQYAAYGLFTFTDYLTSNVRPARMQGFHFGYDAFADAAGMRTTDLDAPITATFMGRASGMVMEPHSDRSQVERLIRVRGDVTLDATIGGANTITGSITNFETPSGRAWGPYAPLTDSVRLTNGTIAADGSYAGDTTVDGAASHLWDNGAFGGNFYGDRGGPALETAGWWYLTSRGYAGALTGADARDHPGRPDFRYSGAFGSFGAACTEGCE